MVSSFFEGRESEGNEVVGACGSQYVLSILLTRFSIRFVKPVSPDEQILLSVAKFDVHVLEEASYILWHIWRGNYKAYETLPACIDALSNNAALYQSLKDAHGCRNYDLIRNWNATANDCNTDDTLRLFLAELEPALTRLVAGELSFLPWVPTGFPSETLHHLDNLRIPCVKGKPNLLLHDLGCFASDETLQNRIRNIFMPCNHTFLVNTSGSGKTRLLLEGLCENWGFYFTSLIDSSMLGSSDVQNAITTRIPDSPSFHHHLPPTGYESSLESNRKIANRIFRQIFLARLLIFHEFARLMSRHPTTDPHVYKVRWLFLQLQPSIAHPHVWDVFDELSTKLSAATDAYINSTTLELLTAVRGLLQIADNGLFCVLDEAQYAATQLQTAFRSDNGAAHRPVLREIVRAWESQTSGRGVFMVVAGTGISKDVVDQAMASAIMKDSRYRWCSDTGAFDHINIQHAYLRKYIPPRYLESAAGKRLLERVWYWLHGRHRFTAGYVSELILNGFQRPHALLNAYIHHFSGFSVTDGASFIETEGQNPLPALCQYKLDFSKLTKREDMLSTIHQLTAHYLMRSTLPHSLGKDEATYVEYGFARFVDSATKTVVVDEPLVLLAATHWLNKTHNRMTCYKYFAKRIHMHDPLSNGFENYIAFCIDVVFSSRPRRALKDIFTFHGTTTPEWANLDAQLVALHRTGDGDGLVTEVSPVRHFEFSGPSLTLGVNAKTPEDTTAWLDAQRHAAMCFPHTSMGPDVMFVLKLSDGSLIWVAVQTKYSQGRNGYITRPLLRQAMRSVTPSRFWVDKEGNEYCPSSIPDLFDKTQSLLKSLPNRRSDAGPCSLLRVLVSFPADVNIKRCLNEDPDACSHSPSNVDVDADAGGHPIATLNIDLLKQLTRKMSPVDYLQVLQDPLLKANGTRGRKRKRGVGGVGDAPAAGLSTSGGAGRSKKARIRLKI